SLDPEPAACFAGSAASNRSGDLCELRGLCVDCRLCVLCGDFFPMNYKFLLTRRDGPVEYLTLNRPDVRNAFNAEMIAELASWASETAQKRGDVRAVVIGGAGKAFCAGADAAWLAKIATHSQDDNIRDATVTSRMFRGLDELPMPVIGRIHGAAIGGGAGLAAVCDVVVAAEDAVFGFTGVKLGIIPAVISPFVLHTIRQ